MSLDIDDKASLLYYKFMNNKNTIMRSYNIDSNLNIHQNRTSWICQAFCEGIKQK
jgi:hypothetical protein